MNSIELARHHGHNMIEQILGRVEKTQRDGLDAEALQLFSSNQLMNDIIGDGQNKKTVTELTWEEKLQLILPEEIPHEMQMQFLDLIFSIGKILILE
jgi:hypothetical protein